MMGSLEEYKFLRTLSTLFGDGDLYSGKPCFSANLKSDTLIYSKLLKGIFCNTSLQGTPTLYFEDYEN
jgi:hypothetical protein